MNREAMKINWKRVVVTSAWVSVVGVSAFLEGTVFGGTYGYYRFVYAAPHQSALRGAFSKLVGREKNYAQFDQDLWVTRGVAPGKRDGYYLDVGSADGVRDSNTKLLDDLGWNGVCIDPFPTNMEHRTCQVVRQPVFNESGKRVKFRAAGLLGGIEQDLDRYKAAKRVVEAPEVEFVTTTLDEVLAKAHAPNYIDYMNLDVEGGEYDALRGLSLDRYQIGALTVEHNWETAKRDAIHSLLVAKGYVRVRSWDVDDWYVHRTLASHFPDFIGFCSDRANCPN
jgi:hypothetical protein